MGEWISDTFYSYFPSFNILDQKRQNLAKDRQREYQEYLKRVSQNPTIVDNIQSHSSVILFRYQKAKNLNVIP